MSSRASRPFSASPTTSTRPLLTRPRMRPSRKKGRSSTTTTRTRGSDETTTCLLPFSEQVPTTIVPETLREVPMSETTAGVARVEDVVAEVTATHAARGARLQAWLRVVVVAFVWACLLLEPPTDQVGWCYAIAVAYPVLWALTMPFLGRSGKRGPDLSWVPLQLVIAVLGVLAMLAGLSAEDSWTAYMIVNGFFILPVLAATQLSPRVGLA